MITQLIILIVLIVLGVLAFRLLIGLIRITVTSVIFLLAVGVAISLISGQDVVSPAVSAVVSTIQSNVSAP